MCCKSEMACASCLILPLCSACAMTMSIQYLAQLAIGLPVSLNLEQSLLVPGKVVNACSAHAVIIYMARHCSCSPSDRIQLRKTFALLVCQ